MVPDTRKYASNPKCDAPVVTDGPSALTLTELEAEIRAAGDEEDNWPEEEYPPAEEYDGGYPRQSGSSWRRKV